MYNEVKACAPTVKLVICQLFIWGIVHAGPDSFTEPQKIATGSWPRIAINYEDRSVHMLHHSNGKFVYRKGDLSGKFGAEETVYAGRVWDPRITLDKNGNPHVVISTNQYINAKTFYTNRIGGKWKPIVLALEKCDKQKRGSSKSRATTPSVAVDDDGTVFVSAFIGCLCRIENASTQPKVVTTMDTKNYWGHIPLFIRDGELWIHKGQPYGYVNLDKNTLKEKGQFFKATGYGGEQTRASIDHIGDIHSAGGAISLKGPGWYNSLSRAKAGKPNIRFKTTQGHESGGAMPVRDRNHPDRVYVVHWSGAQADKYGAMKGCKSGNQLHFARIEDGALKTDLNKVTDRKGPHSQTFRNTPVALAHPDGGMVVLFNECKSQEIFMTLVGQRSSVSIKPRNKAFGVNPVTRFDEFGRVIDDQYEINGTMIHKKLWGKK